MKILFCFNGHVAQLHEPEKFVMINGREERFAENRREQEEES